MNTNNNINNNAINITDVDSDVPQRTKPPLPHPLTTTLPTSASPNFIIDDDTIIDPNAMQLDANSSTHRSQHSQLIDDNIPQSHAPPNDDNDDHSVYSELLNAALHNLNNPTPVQHATLQSAIKPQALDWLRRHLDQKNVIIADLHFLINNLSNHHRRLRTKITNLETVNRQLKDSQNQLSASNARLSTEVAELKQLINTKRVPKKRAEKKGAAGKKTINKPPLKKARLNNNQPNNNNWKQNDNDTKNEAMEFAKAFQFYKAFNANRNMHQ